MRTNTSPGAGLASLLPGHPDDTSPYSPASLLGLSPGTGSKAAGASLPPVTAMGGDRQQVWWSPDSPTFWAAGLIALTVFGMVGADVKVRLFKRRAEGRVGDT